jgi:hypothetical protein
MQARPDPLAIVEARDVENEPNLLVALLAVRALGGQSVQANHEVVKKLKTLIQQGVSKNLLEERTLTEQVPGKGGRRPRTVEKKVVALTEQGERMLRESADPEALAATQARYELFRQEEEAKARRTQIEQLREEIAADREALKERLQTALAPKSADSEEKKLHKEAEKLSKASEKLSAVLERIVQQVEKAAREVANNSEAVAAFTAKVRSGDAPQGTSAQDGSLSAMIEEGFAAMLAKLDQALSRFAPAHVQQSESTTHHPTAPTQTSSPVVGSTSPARVSDDVVWENTRRAYRELHRAGHLVKIPELNDAVTRESPGLLRQHFYDLLNKWARDDRLVLQLCNDPRVEPRAHEGIESPRGLLFYVQLR